MKKNRTAQMQRRRDRRVCDSLGAILSSFLAHSAVQISTFRLEFLSSASFLASCLLIDRCARRFRFISSLDPLGVCGVGLLCRHTLVLFLLFLFYFLLYSLFRGR